MLKRARNRFALMFAVAILIGILAIYFAIEAQVINTSSFTKGLIAGLLLGAIAGPFSAANLKKRLRNNTIKKLGAKGLIPAILFLLLIVFYPEVGRAGCSIIGILGLDECLGGIYGAFFGALAALFTYDLIWVAFWEYRNKQPMYFE